jgi:hypothetical protein
VDVEVGFTPLALIEHDTPINRSVRIGDRLIAISDGMVSAHDLSDPGVTVDSVEIAASNVYAPTEVGMYVPPADVVMAMAWGLDAAGPAPIRHETGGGPFLNATNGGVSFTASPHAAWAPRQAASASPAEPARAAAFGALIASRPIAQEVASSLAAETVSAREAFEFFVRGARG